MRVFSILIICLFLSCTENKLTGNSPEFKDSLTNKTLMLDSVIINNNTDDLDQAGIYTTGKENFSDTLIYGKRWSEIESSGDPDTALALFAYRIIFTNNIEESDDCLILMNVIESQTTTKNLMKSIFRHKSKIYNFDKSIDSLNKASALHAREIVEQEIQQYGESEGPCFELYEKNK